MQAPSHFFKMSIYVLAAFLASDFRVKKYSHSTYGRSVESILVFTYPDWLVEISQKVGVQIVTLYGLQSVKHDGYLLVNVEHTVHCQYLV